MDEVQVVDRADGANGELVLRRAGAELEIISNGVFLMDTRNGESERLLVSAALERLSGPVRLLIGGLGVGFSLAEAIGSAKVTEITVVEREPAVIGWHTTHLEPFSGGALHDPRVRVECADLLDRLRAPGGPYDAICLDIDNGPDWTVTPANRQLYGDTGLDLLAGRLAPGGVLAVWSAAGSAPFEARLRARFERVEARRIPVPRGEPDVVFLAGAAAVPWRGVPQVSQAAADPTV